MAVGTVLVVIGEDGATPPDEQPRAEETAQKQAATARMYRLNAERSTPPPGVWIRRQSEIID